MKKKNILQLHIWNKKVGNGDGASFKEITALKTVFL